MKRVARTVPTTEPIHVDFLPSDALRMGGRLGLTIAPGKREGYWQRNLHDDLQRLQTLGVAILVSLVGGPELEELGISDLPLAARARGVRVCRFAIQDGDVPETVADTAFFVKWVLEHVRAGDTVAVHCRGGLGRSGLFAACCLVAVGHAPRAALGIVRWTRPRAVETREQESFVERFGDEFLSAGSHSQGTQEASLELFAQLITDRLAKARGISTNRIVVKLSPTPIATGGFSLGVNIRIDEVPLDAAGKRMVERWFTTMGLPPIGQA